MKNWEWFTKEDLEYIESWYMTELDILVAKLEYIDNMKTTLINKQKSYVNYNDQCLRI